MTRRVFPSFGADRTPVGTMKRDPSFCVSPMIDMAFLLHLL